MKARKTMVSYFLIIVDYHCQRFSAGASNETDGLTDQCEMMLSRHKLSTGGGCTPFCQQRVDDNAESNGATVRVNCTLQGPLSNQAKK